MLPPFVYGIRFKCMNERRRDPIPPPFDLLWGLRGGVKRRRKDGLTVERVVQAAVELADDGGLQAVSMSRVARRLGFTTMALYRHVRGKDELVALMVEAAVGQPTLDDVPPEGWRAGLERWTWDLHDVLERHPWLVTVPLASMPFGPNRLAWFESGLRPLAGAGLTELEQTNLNLLLNDYAFSEARLSQEIARAVSAGASEQGAPLDALVDANRFPAARRAVEAGIFDPSGRDRDADFAFGLERILDGIERLIDQRADPARDSAG
jgi:AcrR family transcriptional regulator